MLTIKKSRKDRNDPVRTTGSACQRRGFRAGTTLSSTVTISIPDAATLQRINKRGRQLVTIARLSFLDRLIVSVARKRLRGTTRLPLRRPVVDYLTRGH